jgi:hypothetical protein
VIDANERIAWVHRDPKGDGWSSIIEHKSTDVITTPTLPGFFQCDWQISVSQFYSAAWRP